MHVLATAGHVDHGKSTLVLALTGTDPDRLAEEKARGLTIDLGFAWTTLPSGREVAFVDVPGHVRFIKNMLAGVGAVDACMFVVAATEGWKPQSEEHLRILELLGVSSGLVALTKVGLVDEEWLELARMEVAEHVDGSFLASAEVVEVDAPTGTGLGELRAALDRLLARTPEAVDRNRPRLWIDRVFAAKGSGTVVTGTLAGGSLRVDEELLLVASGTPLRVRVRALQSLGRPRNEVPPGSRVAVNLAGVAHDRVARGDVLVRPGQWLLTRMVDASLRVLPGLGHDVGRRGAYAAYVGSGEHPVRLRVLGAEGIPPGGEGFVRLHLPLALPLLPGDRYVLREHGRAETVGGGEILDVDPVLPASKARPSRDVERVIAERGWITPEDLEVRTGERRPPNLGRWVVAPGVLARTAEQLRGAVAAAGAAGLDLATLDERRRAVLAILEDVTVEGGRARPRGAPVEDPACHPWLVAATESPFAPPEPTGVDRALLREMQRRGLAAEHEGVWFAASAVDAAARLAARLLAESPEGFTVARFRDAAGCTRKHALPLLALLDARGVTRRRGDVRVGGPRLPAC